MVSISTVRETPSASGAPRQVGAAATATGALGVAEADAIDPVVSPSAAAAARGAAVPGWAAGAAAVFAAGAAVADGAAGAEAVLAAGRWWRSRATTGRKRYQS